MSWGYGYYRKPTVASQRAQAEKRRKQLEKKLGDLQPVLVEGNKIAKTWWGMSWNRNLESYADYSNRIGRGRSYCKNGLVLDLRIAEGQVKAKVSGSSIYDVSIQIDKLPEAKWEKIAAVCAGRVESMEALIEGRFPQELSEAFLKQGDGLFPTPKEISFKCSCPDWASMCKHVAAALYGIGARLDQDPMLFFTLRGVDPAALIKRSVEEKMQSLLANAEGAGKKSRRIIGEREASRIFGV